MSKVPGYSETFFRNKIKFLQNEGFDVILFVDEKDKGFDLCPVVEGFPNSKGLVNRLIVVLRLILRIVVGSHSVFRLWTFNRRDGFKIGQNVLSIINSVHILRYSLDWLHFGFAALSVNRENLAGVIDAKLAVSIRGYDINVFPLKHPGIYDLLWKRLNKLHYISEALLDRAIELGFRLDCPHQKIRPAIDINLFKQQVNQGLIKGHTIRFTTVARLNWIKGLNYVLEALEFLKIYGIKFQYNIIGEGSEYENLIFMRNQLALNDDVVFLGMLSPTQIKQNLENTDIYIQYSLEEGFCNAVLEAQAMGCLCVVSDAGGLSENVLDRVTGFVVGKRNSKLLAEKIIDVIYMSDEVKSKVREMAVTRVKDEFNLRQQQISFLQFYTS